VGVEIVNDAELEIPGYPGVIVTASKPATLREFFLLKRIGRIGELEEENLEEIEGALAAFGDTFLKDWNVDVRGEPLPATGAGLLTLPVTFQFGLLRSWLDAVSGTGTVDTPLDGGSASGNTSLEESVPMEAL